MTAGEIIPESVFGDWGIIQPEDGGYFEFDSFNVPTGNTHRPPSDGLFYY